jgi:hypothetical protein
MAMQFDINTIFSEMRATVQDPRSGARRVMAANLSMNEAALALLIVAILTAIISAFVGQMAQGIDTAAMPMAALSPVQWAVMQIAAMFVGAALIAAVGRFFGGQGTLAQSIALLAWAEFIVLMVQIAQVLSMFILPPVAVILAVIGIALTLWLIVNFVAELHGFDSLFKVFFALVGVSFLLVVILATIMAVLVGAPGA